MNQNLLNGQEPKQPSYKAMFDGWLARSNKNRVTFELEDGEAAKFVYLKKSRDGCYEISASTFVSLDFTDDHLFHFDSRGRFVAYHCVRVVVDAKTGEDDKLAQAEAVPISVPQVIEFLNWSNYERHDDNAPNRYPQLEESQKERADRQEQILRRIFGLDRDGE